MRIESDEAARRRIIVETLRDRPFATVKDLLAVLDVSPATIRRDIAKLHELGEIRKVFGGIASAASVSSERLAARPYEENKVLNVDLKRAIAAEAETLVRDGDSIIVHGGSTCFLFSQRLAKRSIKIYTNSMPLAAELWENGVCHLTLAGGELHRESGIVYSRLEEEPEFYGSKFFVGAQGIGPEGLLESHPLMARSVARLADHADEVVVLADSTKFGIRTRHAALSLSRVGTLVTDQNLTDEDRDMLHAAGVKIIIAGPAEG